MDAEFSDFFRAHAAYVAESLRRLGVAPADAEDMTHEVFLAVHRRFSEYDRVRSGKPWLFAFAIRIASNYRQRSSFRSEVLGSSGDDPEIADSRPDVLAKLEQDASAEHVCSGGARWRSAWPSCSCSVRLRLAQSRSASAHPRH